MKCGVCSTRLTTEAEEYDDGRADWWICKKCYVTRELEPYDKPETAEEQEQWDQRFEGKRYPQRLSEDSEGRFADLTAALMRLHRQQ